ncbi:1,3-beta-glucanosyltransferase gel4 [Tolypocladium ophioglossoides CBS 100239]|uniref:1,3-beta-glucanosyltransferase n=1 Tax=Tolypocladium ophioglossoides (strain CBS 100239) TaxID=1163406 RepID=A0A0L0NI08_TOLOC|nr:1,3-beta-glucanosyltransferase gel4 [Tolypocladium ophioglossoides CBS 100239]
MDPLPAFLYRDPQLTRATVLQGSKFFYPNGTQFFLKGVAYQQDTSAAGATPTNATFVDPLSDTSSCQRDVPLLAELGTNIIRTYAIDPAADHSACMKLLNDAGIYVISDLSQPSLSINRNDPEWNVDLFTHYQKVVDTMVQYSNVVGFFAGNEVSNQNNNTGASAYVKAAVRDTKQYIKDKNYRWMGVGYAANDDPPIRDQIADYFNCGPADESVDFFGYNIYSWCGSSDFEASGYNRLIDFFQTYSVPMFFAEYGCNLPGGAADRTFEETTALYSSNMSAVVSGGIVYEYFEEVNDYGLVTVSSDGTATKSKDFSALQQKVRAVDPKGVSMADYNPTAKPANCPQINSTWEANSVLPPTPNESVCSCMVKSSECVPASNLASSSYGDIFNYICGKDESLCSGIQGNSSTGVYGAYTMCADQDKLAFVLNAYYQSLNKAADACDFNGQAKTQAASSQGNCTTLATSKNTTSHNFAVMGTPLARAFTRGEFSVNLYLVVALVGAGMVAL